MEDSRKLWNDALAMIRERVGDHAYDVWFRDITADSYDEQQNSVVLCVPNSYVYEYLEECRVGLLSEVLGRTFGPGVRLGYRVAQPVRQPEPPALSFEAAPVRPRVAVQDAAQRLRKGLDYFVGEGNAKWLPAYDEVAAWLTDSKGKGLLCVGTSGLGKTLLCQKILPVILGSGVKSVTAKEMSMQIDDLLTERVLIVDDIGREDAEVWLKYKRRAPFFELCDAAERTGMLLILTTSLSPVTLPPGSPYPDSIEHRYGPEVLSRLRALTHLVLFQGDDMRR